MADLNSVAPMLKEVWPESFETAFSQEIVALSRIEASSDGVRQDVSGRYTVIPLKVRRNQGLGSRPERGILPLPGKQGYVGTRVQVQHQYAVGEITSQALLLADREPRSFINTLDQELSGMRDDAMKDYARMVYGFASGKLAEVTAVDGTTLTVDRIQYFEPEMRLDAVDETGPDLEAEDVEVLSVNIEDHQIEVDDATGITIGAILVRHGNYNQEITGFRHLIDDELAVQNLDPSEEPKWASHVRTGNARPWSELEIVAANDYVRRTSGKNISVMFTGFGVRRAVFADLKQQREYVNTIEFGHGFSALPFNLGAQTIPLVEDPDYPEDYGAETGSILGVDEDSVGIWREESGWHFAEESGSMFIPAQDRSDAWEFRMRHFSQMGITQRNNHFRIDNIETVDNGSE